MLQSSASKVAVHCSSLLSGVLRYEMMLRAALYCFLALRSTYAVDSGASKSSPQLYLVLMVRGL